MSELEKCIKRLNLIFTNTTNKMGIFNDDFDLEKESVNYNKTISLYDLVDIFNRLYLSFKKEYQQLDKLELGEGIEVKQFIKKSDENYRHLLINISKSVKEPTLIYFTECNNEIKSYITNAVNPSDKKYYSQEVSLNKKNVKDYLELFEKYELLLYLYHHFQYGMIISDGTHTLSTKINSENNIFSDNLKNFIISASINNYKKPSDFIKLSVNLGDSFGINYFDCKLVLSDEEINITDEGYLKILKSIFINDRYLNTYWDRVDCKEKISAKSLIKMAA